MGIYASAVTPWFMAIALLLIGASIRAWFRSPRPVIDETASIAQRPDADDTTLIEPVELAAV